MERPHWRKMSWVVLTWNALMVVLTIGAFAFAHSHHTCQNLPTQLCDQATSAITTAGAWVVVAIWLIGDVLLGGIWLATKQSWRVCPACGLPLGAESKRCDACGARLSASPPVTTAAAGETLMLRPPQAVALSPSSSPGTSVYRMYSLWRFQLLSMSVIFGMIAISLLGSAARGGEPGWPFAIFWSATAAFVVPAFLLKVSCELRLEEGAIFRWKTSLRSGSLPVASIRDVRPFFLLGPLSEVIQFEDGHRIIVMLRKGFIPFLNDLSRADPSLSIDVSQSWSRLAERWPFAGRGGYEHWN